VDPRSEEWYEAANKVGTTYCISCYVDGSIKNDEPDVVEMGIRWSQLGQDPYREDVQLKCPKCFTTRTVGFGLTEEEYLSKVEKRGGRVLDPVKHDIQEANEDFLETMGYIEA